MTRPRISRDRKVRVRKGLRKSPYSHRIEKLTVGGHGSVPTGHDLQRCTKELGIPEEVGTLFYKEWDW